MLFFHSLADLIKHLLGNAIWLIKAHHTNGLNLIMMIIGILVKSYVDKVMFFIINENHLLIGISRIILDVLKVDELLRGNQLLIAHNVSQSSLLINSNGLDDLSSPICHPCCQFLQRWIPCTAR